MDDMETRRILRAALATCQAEMALADGTKSAHDGETDAEAIRRIATGYYGRQSY